MLIAAENFRRTKDEGKDQMGTKRVLALSLPACDIVPLQGLREYHARVVHAPDHTVLFILTQTLLF